MNFYHKIWYRLGDIIVSTGLFRYFYDKYGSVFYYQDVNFDYCSMDFIPDNLVVFASDNFYGFPSFDPVNLWWWNSMLQDKGYFSTSKFVYGSKSLDIDLVFVPLLFPDYNVTRGMDIENLYDFIRIISELVPNNKIIIDLKKRQILNLDHPNVVYSDDIKFTCDLINRSKIFIGGDTGVSHFAGSINHPNMILLYPEYDFEESFGIDAKQLIFKNFNEPDIFNYKFSCLPCCDPKNYQVLTMNENKVDLKQFLISLEIALNKKSPH